MSAIAKFLTALVTVVVMGVIAVQGDVNLADGLQGEDWAVIVLGIVNAAGVYLVPNRPAP